MRIGVAIRLALVVGWATLAACVPDVPDAPDPGAQAPAPAKPAPGGFPSRTGGPNGPPQGEPAKVGGNPVYTNASLQAETRLVRYALQKDPGELAAARALLEAARAATPSATFDGFLLAYVAKLQGDTAGETAALAGTDPGRRAGYTWFFSRPIDALLPYLATQAADVCKMGGAPNCPPRPAQVPDDYVVWEQLAWASHGVDRVAGWTGYARAVGTDDLLDRLGVKAGMRVADVGAGEGYFTLPIARRVGPTGAVTATEIDAAFTRFITYSAEQEGLANVRTIVQGYTSPELPPGSQDLVVLCEVFKALTTNAQARDPAHVAASVAPFLANVRASLAPGGRFAVIEHDSDPSIDNAISAATIDRLMGEAGFAPAGRVEDFLPLQLVLFYEPA